MSTSFLKPPQRFFTDSNGVGDYGRLRVDVGQTGFFAGREFRTYHEFSLTSGQVLVVKAVTPIDTILQDLSVQLNSGEVKVLTLTGGTEGGSFTTLTNIPTNSMSTASGYSDQLVASYGGSHTGGTEIDRLWIDAGTNPVLASTSKGNSDSVRGVPAGTYYFRIEEQASSTATGIFRARWEERPEGV